MPKRSETRDMGKPAGYPLPWCELLDAPYWQVNLALCVARDGWSIWQSHKPMVEIIPEIDRLLATA